MYVCQTITFESLRVRSSWLFAHPVYLHGLGIRVKFAYEDRTGLTIVSVCTMRGPPPPGGGRSTVKFFPRCFDFERLNVTTKKVVNFLGEEKCTSIENHPGQNPGYAYRKIVPALRSYAPPPSPEWLIQPCMKISVSNSKSREQQRSKIPVSVMKNV